MLAFHDLLHEISELMIEADANLTIEDVDDFYRSMALLGEALAHLLQDERLTLSNILYRFLTFPRRTGGRPRRPARPDPTEGG